MSQQQIQQVKEVLPFLSDAAAADALRQNGNDVSRTIDAMTGGGSSPSNVGWQPMPGNQGAPGQPSAPTASGYTAPGAWGTPQYGPPPPQPYGSPYGPPQGPPPPHGYGPPPPPGYGPPQGPPPPHGYGPPPPPGYGPPQGPPPPHGTPPPGPPVVAIQCHKCSTVYQIQPGPGCVPGSEMKAACSRCGTPNRAIVPGSAPMHRPHGGGGGGLGGVTPSPSGTQRAVLVGINYGGTPAKLRGCHNDVRAMQQLLMQQYGWQSSSIKVLMDDGRHESPTRSGIINALRWLVHGARPGDVFVFHFSGHGAQQEDPQGLEEDGMNETILPVDFKRAGMISDDEISQLIVHPLPEGCKLTALLDSCHSGTGLDLPYTWVGGRGWKEDTNPHFSRADVQLFSGCEDSGTSADASNAYGAAAGAMTTAFCDALRANPCPTYPELISSMLSSLRRRGFHQRPQLSSTQRFSFDRPFLLTDIIPNSNTTIGRVVRRKFKPRRRRLGKHDPLGGMLGIGAAVVGGMILGDMIGGLLDGL